MRSILYKRCMLPHVIFRYLCYLYVIWFMLNNMQPCLCLYTFLLKPDVTLVVGLLMNGNGLSDQRNHCIKT